MANLGKTEEFQPMAFFKGEPLTNKSLVRHMFDKINDLNDVLLVEYRNDPLAVKVRVVKTYENFVLLHKKVVIEGEAKFIPFTISYAEVISQDVRIKGKKGKLKPWLMTVLVPERQASPQLTDN